METFLEKEHLTVRNNSKAILVRTQCLVTQNTKETKKDFELIFFLNKCRKIPGVLLVFIRLI